MNRIHFSFSAWKCTRIFPFRLLRREIFRALIYTVTLTVARTQLQTLTIERQNQRMSTSIDEFTAVTRWQHERMDYSMAVAGLQYAD